MAKQFYEGLNSNALWKEIDERRKRIKQNEPSQKGGSQELDFIRENFQIFRDMLNIYKTDMLLKTMGLMSDETLFKQFYGEIYQDDDGKADLSKIKDFLDVFFIEIKENNDPVYNVLNSTGELKEKMTRDSAIYKQYVPDMKNNVILIPTLLKIIISKEIKLLLRNTSLGHGLVNLINQLLYVFERLRSHDEIPDSPNYYETIMKQNSILQVHYENFVNDRKRVFAYIKERCDTPPGLRNPRFALTIQDDKFLLLRYHNLDGNIDMAKSNSERLQQIESNTGKNTEYYYMGAFDGIFPKEETSNAEIAKKTTVILDKLIKKDQDVCVIGYGQSGSGKTSTLIYFKNPITGKEEDGILMELCNMQDFADAFDEITVDMQNIYVFHGTGRNDASGVKMEDYKTKPIVLDETRTEPLKFSYYTDGKLWILSESLTIENGKQKLAEGGDPSNLQRLGMSISDAFDKREVEPTPNNPNSSRSHVVVCLLLKKKESNDTRKLVICDLAGVENVFQCGDMNALLAFNDKYLVSGKYRKNEKDPKAASNKNFMKFDKYYCEQGDPGLAKINYDAENTMYNESVKIANNNYEFLNDLVNKVHLLDKEININNPAFIIKETPLVTAKPAAKKISAIVKGKPTIPISKTKRGGGKYECIEQNVMQLSMCDKELFKDPDVVPIIEEIKTNVTENSPYAIKKALQIINDRILGRGAQKDSTGKELPPIESEKEKIVQAVNSFETTIRGFENEIQKTADKLNHSFRIANSITNDTKDAFVERNRLTKKVGASDEEVKNNWQNVWDYINSSSFKEMIDKATLSADEKKVFGEIRNDIATLTSGRYAVLKKIVSPNIGSIGASNNDIIKKMKDDLEPKKKDLRESISKGITYLIKLYCLYDKFDKLYYNCVLRRHEGYMINKSLKDIREDVKRLVMDSLSSGQTPPIYYNKQVYPYCLNVNTAYDYFSKFYNATKKSDGKVDVGIIAKVMMDTFKIVLSNLNFVVVTVINTSDVGAVNNPPNPPYINLNNLKYYCRINKDVNKLREASIETVKTLAKYKFYNTIPAEFTVSEAEAKLNHVSAKNNMIVQETYATNLINYVQVNNSATLIGSLESTEVLLNVAYDDVVCAHNDRLHKGVEWLKSWNFQKINAYGDTDMSDINMINQMIV